MFFYSSPISKCRVLGELNQEVQWNEMRGEEEESFFFLSPLFLKKNWGGGTGGHAQRLRSFWGTVLCTVKEEEEGPPSWNQTWKNVGNTGLPQTEFNYLSSIRGGGWQCNTKVRHSFLSAAKKNPGGPRQRIKKVISCPFFQWNSLAFPVKKFCHAPFPPFFPKVRRLFCHTIIVVLTVEWEEGDLIKR